MRQCCIGNDYTIGHLADGGLHQKTSGDMMNLEAIKLYYAYNEWANERILNAAEQLTREQLLQPNELGWGDLRGALAHTLDAEFGWFNFLFDRGRGKWIKAEDFADLPALRARWQQQNAVTKDCLESLQDEDLTRVHTSVYEEREYHWVLWQVLVHVVNHGTQHRSECAALLTGLGHSPGDMDLSLFMYEHFGRSDFPLGESQPVKREEIDLLISYSDWANDRILDCAESVSQEQLTAVNDFGWGSLRGTLTHLMDAEYHWRELLKEGVFVEDLQPESFADAAAIRARWTEEREAFWRYLESLSDADLNSAISYEARGAMRHRLLWQCLAHLVNHGTQHRAECAALLTGFGHSPGNLDLTEYLSDA